MLIERVEADVEVGRVDEAGLRRKRHELGRLGSGHCQWLLAHDVAACPEDRAGLADVEVVGRGDVDHVDAVVGKEVVQAHVGAGDAQGVGADRTTLRGTSEDAADLHTDAPQRLDVDGPDEARADDRGSDISDPGHRYGGHLSRRSR